MKYLFIDDFDFEIRNEKGYGKYFGLAFVLLDSSKYNKFKKGFDSFLKKIEWPTELEFKTRFIFDGKGLKGDQQEIWKSRQDKIRDNMSLFFNEEILEGKHRKLSLYYFYIKGKKDLVNYKKVLLRGVSECLKARVSSEVDKNYCAVFADEENSFSLELFKDIFLGIKTKTVILEGNLNFVSSSNFSPGIQLADSFAYFAKWYLSDDKEIRQEINLFDNENQKLKKKTMRTIEEYLKLADPKCNLIN